MGFELKDREREIKQLTEGVCLNYAVAFNHILHLFSSQFVTYKPIVKYQQMEQFGVDFEEFENNLFVDLGIEDTTFGERFSGALMSDALRNRKIRLTRMEKFHSKSDQLVGTRMDVQERDEPVNLATDSACMWIGRNCTTCDNVTSYPNQSNGKTFVRLEKWKSTMVFQEATSAAMSPGEIQKEIRNAKPAIDLFSKEKKNNFEVFFTFITNTRLPTPLTKLQETILKDDHTMIVSSSLITVT